MDDNITTIHLNGTGNTHLRHDVRPRELHELKKGDAITDDFETFDQRLCGDCLGFMQ